MADDGTMEAFQALHRDLTTVADALKEDREDRGREALSQLPDNPLLEILADKFQHLLEKPGKKKESRDTVLSGWSSLNCCRLGIAADERVHRKGSY